MMTREAALRLFVLVWLTVVWIWLWGDVSFANVAGGLAVGLLIMLALPLPPVPVAGRLHPLSLLKLITVATYYAMESSVLVGWLSIRPQAPPVTGALRVSLAIKSDLVMVLCCNVLNLIPGTMVLEIDQVRRIMYVHVLDVSTDKAVADFYRSARLIERLLIDTFERDSEWQPSPWRSGTEETI